MKGKSQTINNQLVAKTAILSIARNINLKMKEKDVKN